MENLEKEIKNIKQEILIHKNLKYKHIVRLFGYFFAGNRVYLVLEYASGGSLFSFVRKTKGLSEPQFHKMFKEVCKGVEYLHNKNIIHRDIKPENILIDHKGAVKLCDFGWSAVNRPSRKTFCGTYEYMAPEIFENKKYNHKVDIWSLGILLFELLHGYSPFRGPSVLDIYRNILRGKIKFKKSLCPMAKNLILEILQFKMQSRPDIKQILKHSYMGKFEKKAIIQNNHLSNKNNLDLYYKTQEKNEEKIRKEFLKSQISNMRKNEKKKKEEVVRKKNTKTRDMNKGELESKKEVYQKESRRKKDKPSQETAPGSNKQKSESSFEKRGHSFKKKLKLASLKNIFNTQSNSYLMEGNKKIKLKSESGGEYGVIQGGFKTSLNKKKSKRSKKSILSSRDGSPKHNSSKYKKSRLNDLLQRKGSIYQEKFAEYAFKPKVPSKSPNRKIKPTTYSFNNSIKKNKNLQKKFTFNYSNSNFINISNRSMNNSKNMHMSSKKFNQNYYNDSSSKRQQISNKLFFLKKNHKTMSKDKSMSKKNQFNLNQLIYKKANNQSENQRTTNLKDQLTNRSIKKPISISNLATYYETGKQRNKILRRTSEVQYLMTEKNSMISKKSNRSLQIFNSKDKIRNNSGKRR